MTCLQTKSKEIRNSILDIFEQGGRGHIPSAFSLVEILVTLYYKNYEITPNNFNSRGRDRVLLSKGHGCMALFAILEDLDFFERSEFKKFCKVDGILGGHPTLGKTPGVEVSSGSLGHGFSIAVGKALSMKRRKVNSNVCVILGDGECNEGSVWEAALSANKNKLDNLTVIIDYNKLQSYASTEEVCPLEPFNLKWESFGFEVNEVDMVKTPYKLEEIIRKSQERPRVIIAHTIKGQGSTILENDLSWHHKNKTTPSEVQILRESLR